MAKRDGLEVELPGRLMVIELLLTRLVSRLPGNEHLFDEVEAILTALQNDALTFLDKSKRNYVEDVYTAARTSLALLRAKSAP